MTPRIATQKDLPQIHKLFVDTVRHTSADDYSPAQIAMWTAGIENRTRWTSALEEQYFIVTEIRDEILGFGSLQNGMLIDFLFTHKDHQGEGIASAIYALLEEKAKSLGSKSISVKASRTAHQFFKHKGFTDVKENHFELSGIDIMNFEMEKKLV